MQRDSQEQQQEIDAVESYLELVVQPGRHHPGQAAGTQQPVDPITPVQHGCQGKPPAASGRGRFGGSVAPQAGSLGLGLRRGERCPAGQLPDQQCQADQDNHGQEQVEGVKDRQVGGNQPDLILQEVSRSRDQQWCGGRKARVPGAPQAQVGHGNDQTQVELGDLPGEQASQHGSTHDSQRPVDPAQGHGQQRQAGHGVPGSLKLRRQQVQQASHQGG